MGLFKKKEKEPVKEEPTKVLEDTETEPKEESGQLLLFLGAYERQQLEIQMKILADLEEIKKIMKGDTDGDKQGKA